MEDSGTKRKRGRKSFALLRKSHRDISLPEAPGTAANDLPPKLDQGTGDIPQERRSGSSETRDRDPARNQAPVAQEEALNAAQSQSVDFKASPVESRGKGIEDAVASPSKPLAELVETRDRMQVKLLNDRVEAIEGALEDLAKALSELPARLRQNLDDSEQMNALVTSGLAEQSQEIKLLAESIKGARSAWDKTQEDLKAMRELVAARDQEVLDRLGTGLEELKSQQIEANQQSRAELASALAELPTAFRRELEGTQLLERIEAVLSTTLLGQSEEIKSLGQTVRGARSAWDKMQEDLTTMRELVAVRDQAVLGLLDSRIAEMQRQGIEAIDKLQVELGGVLAELPKALTHEMEGSEYSKRIRSFISLLPAQRDRDKAIMATIQGARSAFMKVRDELQSLRALMSARDQAVLGLVDSQLEKMQSRGLDARVDEIRRAQGELAGAVGQLPVTIALKLQKTEESEQIRALLESSQSDKSQGTVLMEMVEGTMSALVRIQEELNETRDLAATRDQALAGLVESRLDATPIDQINARMEAIHDWQSKLAGVISELPAAIRRDVEKTLETGKIVELLGSALAEKSHERTYLLNTVEGTRSAFQRVQESIAEMRDLVAGQGKVQEAVDGMRDLLAKRDQAVVQLFESRPVGIQTEKVDSRLEALEDSQGKVTQALSELTTTLRRDIEVAAVVLGDRVGEEAMEILQSVRSLQGVLLAELADASKATSHSVDHNRESKRSERDERGVRRRGGRADFEWQPFSVQESSEDDLSGYFPDARAQPALKRSGEGQKFAVTKPPGAVLGSSSRRSEPKPPSQVRSRKKLANSEEVASKGGPPRPRRNSDI
jgi:hypothetical protein